MRSVYEVLLPVEHPGGVTPALAEGFEIAADGLSITCELREGVQWHSGREFTAEDVVWNFQRPLAADFSGWPGFTSQLASVSEVRALDPRTVRFSLDRPDLNVLRHL